MIVVRVLEKVPHRHIDAEHLDGFGPSWQSPSTHSNSPKPGEMNYTLPLTTSFPRSGVSHSPLGGDVGKPPPRLQLTTAVIPAKAGIPFSSRMIILTVFHLLVIDANQSKNQKQRQNKWIPAFAGMTNKNRIVSCRDRSRPVPTDPSHRLVLFAESRNQGLFNNPLKGSDYVIPFPIRSLKPTVEPRI